MKLCRFRHAGRSRCGIYHHDSVLPLDDLAELAGESVLADLISDGGLESLFPIDSAAWATLQHLSKQRQLVETIPPLPTGPNLQLLPPIALPPKLLLLAGNYAAHVTEQGDVAVERQQTFPYLFMKPPTTTLRGDRETVEIPKHSPDKIDHEVELAVVIGRAARSVSSSTALDYVAGYTIINDLSDRGFRPSPNRVQRPRDQFFDWLGGKWHDGFCPCGPCLVTADEVPDPQSLDLRLLVNGELRQRGSTSEQIFSVAEVIAFISSSVTLEPGDIIATGTPSGVGNASGKFLRPGDTTEATISSIGTLTTSYV